MFGHQQLPHRSSTCAPQLDLMTMLVDLATMPAKSHPTCANCPPKPVLSLTTYTDRTERPNQTGLLTLNSAVKHWLSEVRADGRCSSVCSPCCTPFRLH